MRKTNQLPSIEELNELLTIDTINGTLSWKARANSKRWNTRFAGKTAGTIVNGYVLVRINKVPFYAHRLIYKMVHGQVPDEIDHIDGNTLNNAPCNLRDGSNSENAKNRALQSNNKTGRHGIHNKPGNTTGFIVKVSGKYEGSFDSWDDAVRVRDEAERREGFHINHGRS